MKEEELDQILNRSAGEPPAANPEVLQRIADSVKASLRPVRALPSPSLLTGAVLAVCAAVSVLGAARAGFFGFAKMDSLERWLIFCLLAILAAAAADSFVRSMIPASRRYITAAALMGWSCLAMLGVFALLFRDYATHNFFSVGIACLLTGLLHAVPAGLLSWLVLRRGFAVSAVNAGLAAGLLGGLAGVGMLELHCPNFETAHLLVWHTAVIPLSGALGACAGWLLHRWKVRER
ncbi:MAG: NrsF family protein [Acidobacteriaceae bacterium]